MSRKNVARNKHKYGRYLCSEKKKDVVLFYARNCVLLRLNVNYQLHVIVNRGNKLTSIDLTINL